jgi:hypothetical protein
VISHQQEIEQFEALQSLLKQLTVVEPQIQPPKAPANEIARAPSYDSYYYFLQYLGVASYKPWVESSAKPTDDLIAKGDLSMKTWIVFQEI